MATGMTLIQQKVRQADGRTRVAVAKGGAEWLGRPQKEIVLAI